MPSGTQDWKGCATLQLIFIPLCLFHHIGSHINVHIHKAGKAKAQTCSTVIVTLNPMILWKWLKTICFNFLPPPLSHKFPNKRKKKISIHADQHTNTTDLFIKSIQLVRHLLLSVNTSARPLKDACPLSYPWVRLRCYHFCMCIFMKLWIGSPMYR